MMNRKRLAVAFVLGAALLTLSGCDGTQSGTIDYIDGHWVYTDGQTAQSTDITQLLSDPEAFYSAACALSDGELQGSFDRLSSVQCADIFRSLGEDRAMALAGRLTQAQVERLLTILQGQEKVQALTNPASLAAVWPTLTTDEQLTALSSLSSEDYAALWALLDGATPTPAPDAAQPEATATPDPNAPVFLSGIWHTLTQQEQSDILAQLSSAQFVTLWGLLNEQVTPVPAAETATPVPEVSEAPVAEADAGDMTQTAAQQDAQPGTAEATQTPPAPESPETDAQEEKPDPASIVNAWYALTPEEQLALVKQLATEEFVTLQELLAVYPKPTPAEEDDLFIPSPKPTATKTPAPTPASDGLTDDTEMEEPDWSDPVYLASIWHTLSPEEQLSILSTLTLQQYIALQELLAQQPSSEDSVPKDAEQPGNEVPGSGSGAPDAPENGVSTPDEGTPARQQSSAPSSGSTTTPGEKMPVQEQPADSSSDSTATPDEGTSAPEPSVSPYAGSTSSPADNPAQALDTIAHLLPDPVAWTDDEATPPEGLPVSTPSQDPFSALSLILQSMQP